MDVTDAAFSVDGEDSEGDGDLSTQKDDQATGVGSEISGDIHSEELHCSCRLPDKCNIDEQAYTGIQRGLRLHCVPH